MKAILLAGAIVLFPSCGSTAQRATPHGSPKFAREISVAIEDVRGTYPVPRALVLAVIQQESSFRPLARSPAGARGLMQVMPDNARRLGLNPEDLWDPAKNILAGTRLLAALLAHYRGDVVSALVAYNARPRPVFAPLPRNGETPAYVWNVLSFYEQYRRSEEPTLKAAH